MICEVLLRAKKKSRWWSMDTKFKSLQETWKIERYHIHFIMDYTLHLVNIMVNVISVFFPTQHTHTHTHTHLEN